MGQTTLHLAQCGARQAVLGTLEMFRAFCIQENGVFAILKSAGVRGHLLGRIEKFQFWPILQKICFESLGQFCIKILVLVQSGQILLSHNKFRDVCPPAIERMSAISLPRDSNRCCSSQSSAAKAQQLLLVRATDSGSRHETRLTVAVQRCVVWRNPSSHSLPPGLG